MIKKYLYTAWMSAKKDLNAGVLYLLPNYMLKIVYLLPLVLLWKTLITSGAKIDITLEQMLTYTYMSALLSGLLVIQSPLGSWLYEGLVISLYQRPISIYGHVIAQTLGTNFTTLILFSVPMALVSPLVGISIVPQSWWFILSLVLCVALGFALDFIFASLMIHMINASWIVYSIRAAIIFLFSGAVIPFAALPWGLDKILIYQPFASLAGAPLSIYTGISRAIDVIPMQLFWSISLWILAVVYFKKSQERLVSHGG